jgi:dihydroflavonol-4-reductase
MRVFVTGATGFLGSALAAALQERGDNVVALVRSPAKASDLAALGYDTVVGDLADVEALRSGMDSADAVVHAAAIYDAGVPASRRGEFYDVNVAGTQRVLEGAARAGVGRILYVSTVNALGNSRGAIGDEQTQHDGNYLSLYDETKHQAHLVAERAIAEGLPVVIVMPSAVYGPGDKSPIRLPLDLFLKGRMPMMMMGHSGFSYAYIDDVIAGMLAALDRGRIGESYILSGDNMTLREFISVAAELTKRRAPRREVPMPVLRAIAPLGPVLAPLLGLRPNMRETIAAGDGTYYARHDKATAELGYEPRPLREGLRQTLVAEGRL